MSTTERACKKTFRFLLTIALPLFASSACGLGVSDRPTGPFEGVDGATGAPARIRMRLSTTGDGVLSGVWTCEGSAPSARLSGKFGWWSDDLVLIIPAGDCPGEYRGKFSYKSGRLTARLRGNPVCPDRAYEIDAQKSTG